MSLCCAEEPDPHAYIHLDPALSRLVRRDRKLDIAVVYCISGVREADNAELGSPGTSPVGHEPSAASGLGYKADDTVRYRTDQRELNGVVVGRLQLRDFAPYVAQLSFKSLESIIVTSHRASVGSRSVRTFGITTDALRTPARSTVYRTDPYWRPTLVSRHAPASWSWPLAHLGAILACLGCVGWRDYQPPRIVLAAFRPVDSERVIGTYPPVSVFLDNRGSTISSGGSR